MKKVIILGAGGFAREVIWLIEEINKKSLKFEILGVISNEEDKKISYLYLGNDDALESYEDKNIGLILAIGSVKIRQRIIKKLNQMKFDFPNIIANDCILGNHVKLGRGNIICSHSILTSDITIGNFNIINLSCTIGHDVRIKDFNTINPGSNISGNVYIKNLIEIGTGSKIIQGIVIEEENVLGAGCVVVKNTEPYSKYVGVPAKKLT